MVILEDLSVDGRIILKRVKVIRWEKEEQIQVLQDRNKWWVLVNRTLRCSSHKIQYIYMYMY
jgi:hypothetical protein